MRDGDGDEDAGWNDENEKEGEMMMKIEDGWMERWK